MSASSSLPLSKNTLRRGAALLGVLLLILGQIRLASEEQSGHPFSALAEFLTKTVHLAIPSIQNVLDGAPLLLLGGALLALAVWRLRLLPPGAPFTPFAPALWSLGRARWPWFAAGGLLLGALLWQIHHLDYTWVMALEWWLAPFLFSFGLWFWDRQRQVDLSPHIARCDVLWMLGLFASALIIGVYRLQGLPDALMGDEGSFWTAARDIALGKARPPVFASGVYTFPVLSSIGQAWVLKLFGVDLWGWRFASVLAGALTVFPLYLLGREAFDRKIAVLSGLALVTSPYFLAFSRLGYNNIQALFITTLAFYWLYSGARRGSFLYLFLGGAAAGLGFYTYFAARMALVIGLLFLGGLWLIRTWSFRQVLSGALAFLLGFAFLAAPYLAYGLRHDPGGMAFKVFESVFFNTFNGRLFFSEEELTEVAPLFVINNNELFYHPRLYLILIVRGILRTWLVFQKPWLISEHFIASPLAGTIGVFFYLLGFGALFANLRQPRRLLLLLWYLVIFFGLSVLNTVPPRHTHMVNIIPLLGLLIALGVRGVVEGLRLLFRLPSRFLPLATGLLIAAVALGGLYDYFVRMPRHYLPQPDQILSWTALHAQDERLFYVYQDEEDALQKTPYIFQEFRPDVAFQTVAWTQLENALSPCRQQACLVFYHPNLRQQVEPLLRQVWGERLTRRTFFSVDRIPILAVGMNAPFTFERDRTLRQVLTESYLRPPLLTLLAGLALALLVIGLMPASWTLRLPRPLQALARWFNAPPEAAPAEASALEAEDTLPELAAPAPSPSEPPAWAEEVFAASRAAPTARFALEMHTRQTPAGREIYLRLRLPTWEGGAWEVRLPPLTWPSPLLLSGAVALAILAQILLTQGQIGLGALLYLLGAVMLVVWVRRHRRWERLPLRQWVLSRRAEIALFLLLLAAIAFTRFYDLGYRVYGLEADETKWTAQAWLSVLLGEDLGEFAAMHYQYVPLDFWLRAGFLRLFGLNFLSARLLSACYSLVASLLLYLLVRRLTQSPSAAWLSTALYAFSYVELNASHQALHNTVLEPWLMLAIYLLLLAWQESKGWQYQALGIALALGMLTYETYTPTVLTVLVALLGVALVQSLRRQETPRRWAQRLLLTLWPVALVYLTFTQRYLQTRQAYHFGWLQSASQNGSDWRGALEFLGRNFSLWLESLFVSVRLDDSLLRWNGPFISAWVMPFVLLGLVYHLTQLRRPGFFVLPLWYLLNVVAAPLLLGAVWPRVLYTSLPPLMIWGAFGLLLLLAALRAWLDPLRPWLARLAWLTILGIILVSNYHIFTTRIGDPTDRVKRRELADLTEQAEKQADLLLYPYFAAQNDSVELENHVILFAAARLGEPVTAAANRYERVPFPDLLLALWQNRDLRQIAVIYDFQALPLQEERRQIMQTFRHCYPGARLAQQGRFFELYLLDAQALTAPRCYEAPPPTPLEPTPGAQIPSGQGLTFAWEDGLAQRTGFTFTLERQRPHVYWVEAEEVFQNNGWYKAAEFAADFTGAGFLLDNWQSQPVTYTLNIAQAGTYRVWVRSYKRTYNDQQNYLTIGTQTQPFAGNDIPLNEWVWESLGEFDLPAGPLTLTMSRTYGNDPQYSVFIDSLLITPDLVNPPGPQSVWETVLTRTVSGSASRLTVSEILPPGHYRWNVRVFDGDRLLDSIGTPGVQMPPVEFDLIP